MWSCIKPLSVREAVVVCALGLLAVLMTPEQQMAAQTNNTATVIASR